MVCVREEQFTGRRCCQRRCITVRVSRQIHIVLLSCAISYKGRLVFFVTYSVRWHRKRNEDHHNRNEQGAIYVRSNWSAISIRERLVLLRWGLETRSTCKFTDVKNLDANDWHSEMTYPGGGGPPKPGGGGNGMPGGKPGGLNPAGGPGIPGGANGMGGRATAGIPTDNTMGQTEKKP